MANRQHIGTWAWHLSRKNHVKYPRWE